MPQRAPSPVRFRRLILPIVLLWTASALVRWYRYDERLMATNVSASYHVLLTVEALNRTPATVHHMLPIVTLGRALDRDVPFGASVRAPNGIYYYTSFPPLGFIAPWAFFKLTHLTPTVAHLMVFNFGIHLAATLLLALLISEVLARTGMDGVMQRFVIVLVSLTYLFTFEAAYSHGVVYWHHSLFQVAWLAQLLAAARAFRLLDDGSIPDRFDIAVLLATAFVVPSIEWTGYLTNASIAAAFWWRGRGDRSIGTAARRLAIALVLVTAAAGATLVVQFASVVGLEPLLMALRARAGARSVAHGSLMALASGYSESFGMLLVLAAAVGTLYLVRIRQWPPAWASRLLFVAGVPLLENVVLAEHATIYSYDRLKALVLVILVLAMFTAFLTPLLRDRVLFVWLAVLVPLISHPSGKRLGNVMPALESNVALLERVHAAARPCAVYATNNIARGWVDLSLGANVYESIPSVDSLRRIVEVRGACQGIYLRVALDASESMYLWRFAKVFDAASGRIDSLPGTEPRRPHLVAAARE